MNQHQVPSEKFAFIIEFILNFTDTSPPVERAFAKAKNIWTLEKTALHPSTLESLLFVKNYLDYDCCGFYRSSQIFRRKFCLIFCHFWRILIDVHYTIHFYNAKISNKRFRLLYLKPNCFSYTRFSKYIFSLF